MRTRLLLGAAGLFGIAYGTFRLLEQQSVSQPHYLAHWLVAAIVLHDGVLAPLTVAFGAMLSALVKPRARRYVQGALVTGGLVTLLALPLIHRRGTQPASKVLLTQNYSAHLVLILGLIAGAATLAYALRVVQDARVARTSDTNVRPPAVHTSDSR